MQSTANYWWSEVEVASFPGRSRLQTLIACSIQIRRGRIGRSSHVWWLQVDRQSTHRGWCLTKGSQNRCNVRHSVGTESICKAASIQFGFATPVDCLTQVGVTTVRHSPLVCLPSDYLMSSHMTRSPRPSSSVFAYCKCRRLECPGARLARAMPVPVPMPVRVL